MWLDGPRGGCRRNWALTSGGLYRLELGHRLNNPASRGVALAAGFIQEGIEREKFLIDGQRIDVVTYGRLASDPIPRTEPLPIIAAPRWADVISTGAPMGM